MAVCVSVLPVGAGTAEARAKYSWRVSTSRLSASSQDGSKAHAYFTVTNTGRKKFDYHIIDHGSNWIETYRNGDNKNARNWMELKPGRTHRFRVALDSRRSGVGTFDGRVTVVRRQNSRRHHINVHYVVHPKKPEASYPHSASIDTTVTAGQTNTTNYFKIKNTGNAPLTYRLYTSPRAPWLSYWRGDKFLHKTYQYQVGPGQSHTITVKLNATGYLENADEHTVMKIVTNDGTKLIGADMHVRVAEDSNKLKQQSLIKLNPKNPDPDHWIFRPENDIEVEFQIRNTGDNNWTNGTVKYGIQHTGGVNWSPRDTYYVASTKKPSELWIVNLPMTIPEMTNAGDYQTSWRMFREVNGNKTYFGSTFSQQIEVAPYKYTTEDPLKRLRHESTGEYLFTNNETEVDNAILDGYTFEGVMGNVSGHAFDGSNEITRLEKDGRRVYTSNQDEVSNLMNNGWNREARYWIYKNNSDRHDMHPIWSYRSSSNQYVITSHDGGEGGFTTFHSDLGYIVANTDAPADIAINTETIDFGTIIEGSETTRTFRIENTGYLNLSGDISSSGDVDLSSGSFSLDYRNKTEVNATFHANSTGTKTGTITITSNDSNESTRTINWQAEVVSMPSEDEVVSWVNVAYPGSTTSTANPTTISDNNEQTYHASFDVPFYDYPSLASSFSLVGGKVTTHLYLPENLKSNLTSISDFVAWPDNQGPEYYRVLSPGFKLYDNNGNIILDEEGGRAFHDPVKIMGERPGENGLIFPTEFILVDHYHSDGNIVIEKMTDYGIVKIEYEVDFQVRGTDLLGGNLDKYGMPKPFSIPTGFSGTSKFSIRLSFAKNAIKLIWK